MDKSQIELKSLDEKGNLHGCKCDVKTVQIYGHIDDKTVKAGIYLPCT